MTISYPMHMPAPARIIAQAHIVRRVNGQLCHPALVTKDGLYRQVYVPMRPALAYVVKAA